MAPSTTSSRISEASIISRNLLSEDASTRPHAHSAALSTISRRSASWILRTLGIHKGERFDPSPIGGQSHFSPSIVKGLISGQNFQEIILCLAVRFWLAQDSL